MKQWIKLTIFLIFLFIFAVNISYAVPTTKETCVGDVPGVNCTEYSWNDYGKYCSTKTKSNCCGNYICEQGECSSGCKTDCTVYNCQNNGNCDYLIGENCYYTDCVCPLNYQCNPSNANATSFGCVPPICGDGYCTAGECASGCKTDCSLWQCTNNGRCDAEIGETCENAGWTGADCVYVSSTTVCKPDRNGAALNGTYKVVCGDGYCDSNYELLSNIKESSSNCCRDCECPYGTKCDSTSNSCVECLSDSDCTEYGKYTCHSTRHICVNCENNQDCGGKVCDPTTFTCKGCVSNADCPEQQIWTGSYTCSSDYKDVLETGTRRIGECLYETCQYEDAGSLTPRKIQDCTLSGTYCQNGDCGCYGGYSECEPAKQCVAFGVLLFNEPCKCHFQCESGYCKNSVCIKTATVDLTATLETMDITEESMVTLGVDNDLTANAKYNIVLSIGSGAELSAIMSGLSCSGNQCKISGDLEPRKRTEVRVKIQPRQAGEIPLTASVTVETNDGIVIVLPEKAISLKVAKCGDAYCDSGRGETTITCCTDCGCQVGDFITKFACVNNSCSGQIQFPFIIGLIVLGVVLFLVYMFKGLIAKTIEEKMEEAEKRKRRGEIELKKSQAAMAKKLELEERKLKIEEKKKLKQVTKQIEKPVEKIIEKPEVPKVQKPGFFENLILFGVLFIFTLIFIGLVFVSLVILASIIGMINIPAIGSMPRAVQFVVLFIFFIVCSVVYAVIRKIQIKLQWDDETNKKYRRVVGVFLLLVLLIFFIGYSSSGNKIIEQLRNIGGRATLLSDGEKCSTDKECKSSYCVHNVCRASIIYCGDYYCDSREDCSSCSYDCGSCGIGYCVYSDGFSQCYETCCVTGDICGSYTAYRKCDLSTGEWAETSYSDSSCTKECVPSEYCGDGVCQFNEDCSLCPQDCGTCKVSLGGDCISDLNCESGFCVHNICRLSATYCGDYYCDVEETCTSCPYDCGGCETGYCVYSDGITQCNKECCETGFYCGSQVAYMKCDLLTGEWDGTYYSDSSCIYQCAYL